MVIQKQKLKKLIPTVVYLVLWGVVIGASKQTVIPQFAFNFAILNVVFSYWGMEFKGWKFYVEYLLMFGIYISYVSLGSVCFVLYNGSLPLSQVEFWMVTCLISAILFIFHITSVNFKTANGLVFIKKCIVNRYVLFLTFVIQIYLLTT
jgi:hypothetical protein